MKERLVLQKESTVYFNLKISCKKFFKIRNLIMEMQPKLIHKSKEHFSRIRDTQCNYLHYKILKTIKKGICKQSITRVSFKEEMKRLIFPNKINHISNTEENTQHYLHKWTKLPGF